MVIFTLFRWLIGLALLSQVATSIAEDPCLKEPGTIIVFNWEWFKIFTDMECQGKAKIYHDLPFLIEHIQL